MGIQLVNGRRSAVPGRGKVEFRLRLLKMKLPGCANRKFRMKIGLDETIADCTGLPDPNKDSCTIQRTQMDDVVHASPNDFCQVNPTTGNCDYTVTFTTTSPHKVQNGHRSSVAVRDIKIIDADSNAEAFTPGVLLK